MINNIDMSCSGNNPELIMKAISDFLSSRKKTLDVLKNLDGTMLNQKEVIAGIKDLAKSLNLATKIVQELSEKVVSDEARVKVAEISLELGRLILEVGYLLERVNKDNNGFWEFIVAGVVIALGICGICYFKDDIIDVVSDNTESKPCR